jgi:hypothetical protein
MDDKATIEWVDHMLNGLEILNSRPTPISATDWIAESKSAAANVAKQLGDAKSSKPHGEIPKGKKLNPKGWNQHQKKEDEVYDHKLHPPKGGDSPEYLAARIARDRPDIQEKMKAGEYPSVRAAAVDAGIVKPHESGVGDRGLADPTIADRCKVCGHRSNSCRSNPIVPDRPE